MSSTDGGKEPGRSKEEKPPPKPKAKAKSKKEDPIDVMDSTPFPVPELYFKVFESEADEPESKIRADVNKLYEKWQAEHGRRWPDRGLNTEDLVWLQEEAYKEPGQSSGPPLPPSAMGMKPVEKEEYDGEFISEVDEAAGGAGGDGKKAKGPRKPRVSNFDATKAGGIWVTDEFESDEYMAGNLETMWNMYLWDRDGNPTVMPEGNPDEAAGEESEDWDDFHTAYRPRGINSDDAREAVWCTDEFESDEDNTESEWEPEYVGAGKGLAEEDPINPQYSLRHSAHPLAPFPGEPLKWSSYAYHDGTTFEGLTRDAVPHGMGVMIFGNGTGGGFHFRDVRRGDKYEGEFQAGYAHGLGMMTSEMQGELYVGEFFSGQRHGCGIKIDMKPYYYLLERGDDPTSAYRKTYDQIMRNIEFRTWYRNKALGSDYEDEVLLQAVNDDLGNPYDSVLTSAQHDRKLRTWAAMNPEQKALSKMADIVDKVGGERMQRRAAYGFKGPGYYTRDEDGKLVEDLDSHGNDSEYDSMDLMLGNTTEGGLGLGWADDTQPGSEYPFDPKLAEMAAGDAEDDRLEESEDKDAVLGDDMLNPITGLTVKDYLEGKEAKYKEWLARTAADKAPKAARSSKPGQGMGLVSGVRAFFGFGRGAAGGDGGEVSDDVLALKKVGGPLSRGQQDALLRDMERYDEVFGSAGVSRGGPLDGDATDTRFETESDMMELCDLAEILGTVDEAQQIVNRARMWRWKPYGEVTLLYSQDGQGVPVELMQDPLHYPHGTRFMAPGPAGQVHPLPDDRGLRTEMLRVAHNHQRVYDMYNFDFDPEPGTVQYAIDQRIKRAHELRMSQLARVEEDVDAALKAASGAGGAANAVATLAEAPASSSSGGGSSSSAAQARRPLPALGAGPAPFASMSYSMSAASRVLMDALTSARAPRAAATRRAQPRSGGAGSARRALAPKRPQQQQRD